jgi:hypothetical protein
MLICGAVATVGAIRVLMSLGLKYHDNYEFYGQSPVVVLIPIAGIIGFVGPGITVWWLHNNHWRVSLRTLFIGLTVFAVLLGAFVWAIR